MTPSKLMLNVTDHVQKLSFFLGKFIALTSPYGPYRRFATWVFLFDTKEVRILELGIGALESLHGATVNDNLAKIDIVIGKSKHQDRRMQKYLFFWATPTERPDLKPDFTQERLILLMTSVNRQIVPPDPKERSDAVRRFCWPDEMKKAHAETETGKLEELLSNPAKEEIIPLVEPNWPAKEIGAVKIAPESMSADQVREALWDIQHKKGDPEQKDALLARYKELTGTHLPVFMRHI